MEYLARTVRVEDAIISDQERNYGRRYAGRVGRVEAFSSEPAAGRRDQVLYGPARGRGAALAKAGRGPVPVDRIGDAPAPPGGGGSASGLAG